MNEQRQQACLNLIQTLLNCPSGEEPEILAANTELLDADYVQVMLKIASSLIQQSELDQANRLMNIAACLLGVYDNLLSTTTATQEQYLNFLLQIFQATADSSGDPQVIYPLLAANTNKLNNIFVEVMRFWATTNLKSMPSDEAQYQSLLISNFSDLINQFHLGKQSNNIEIGITGYKIALAFLNPQTFPQQWAATQNNLGVAYYQRILGDRPKNIECAIAAYIRALELRKREVNPQAWAETKNNLGLAYTDRILENRAENIEEAIKACKDALTVFTYEDLPLKWAEVQNNLGIAYSNRILGDPAENIEEAIKAYKHALKVFAYEDLPLKLKCAGTLHNLGNAYINRRLKDKKENIELAIEAYQQALTVRTRDVSLYDWAMTQNHLGIAYHHRIQGDPAENIEQAIQAYTDALEVRTRKALLQQWAATQDNLGTAYYDRKLGDQAENIELAIEAYQQALEVRNHEVSSYDWAMTQNHLGNAYAARRSGEPAKNFEKAIAAYTAALEVYTRTAFPQNYAQTLLNIGLLHQDNKQFDLAYNIFVAAIETVEDLRGKIISGEEAKRKQAEEWNQLYRCMAEVCLALKKDTEAIEYIECSKTRNLVELILERDSKTIFPPEVFTQLEQLRDEIASKQYQLQNGKTENPTALAQHLQKLRQQRNNLQDQYLPVGSGFQFDQFQETLDTNTAVIEWYIALDKILAFIIKTHGQKLTVWQSQPEDLDALINWVNEYLGDYYKQKDKWRNQLEERLKELTNILHIEEILNLAQIPKDYKLILIPHRFLHLLPLHALPVGESCLIDLFPNGVSYAPSCQILQQVQQRQRPNFQSLFAIQNPTGDLNYTDLEVQVIQSYFNPANVLKKTAATLTAINQSNLNTYHCAHFSCHGYFNLTNASKSALILANAPVADTPIKPDSERYLKVRAGETHDLEKCLTLDKIFALKLENCRLVTLSACETGLIDFQNTSDEYIGLPSGFLLAGSPSVVSSLWKVNDLSTSFLMIKFYENLVKLDNLKVGDVAIALKQAQNWLRNLTIEELFKFCEDKKVIAKLRKGQLLIFEESLKLIKQRQPLPFANSYYWAGFIASGL